jgi:hypothetical protein
MTTPDFRVRFVGRFVFACEGQVNHPSRIDALAVNMGYNADLHSDSHHTLLTVQRRHVSPRVSSFANHSAYAPTVAPDVDAEVFIWDVSESDVEFHGHAGGNFSFEGWDDVPDLGKLAGGGRVDKDLVLKPLGTRSPVSSRFRLASGLVRAVQFEEGKRVRFDPLEEEAPQGAPDAKLPDAVEIDLKASARTTPLTITVTSHRDGRRRSIVVPAPAVDVQSGGEPVVISITNLCAARAPVTGDDREFAAYYDVMTEPHHPRHRLVPFTTAALGGRNDCTGVAKAEF